MKEQEKLFDQWMKESISDEKEVVPSKNFTLQVMQHVMKEQKRTNRVKIFRIFGIFSIILLTIISILVSTDMPMNFIKIIWQNIESLIMDTSRLPLVLGIIAYLIIGRILLGALLAQKLVVKFRPL